MIARFKKNSSLLLIIATTIILFSSCDNSFRRKKLFDHLKDSFINNKTSYTLLANFLLDNNDSIFAFKIDNKTEDFLVLELKQQVYRTDNIVYRFKDIKEIERSSAPKSELFIKAYRLMKHEKIRDIRKIRNKIFFNHETQYKIPCVSFWYDPNFIEKENKTEIGNFGNLDTDKWIKIIEKGWYVKGEICFS